MLPQAAWIIDLPVGDLAWIKGRRRNVVRP